jgi:hypothetical protein
MADPPQGSTTGSLQERDARMATALTAIIRNPGILADMDQEEVVGDIKFCVKRLRLVRMGGRSVALVALSVILWYAKEPEQIPLDIEDLLVMAFGITTDPSYIWPEWGVVLAGVLIARYLPLMAEDSERQKQELTQQCRLRVAHLCRQIPPVATRPARDAAQALRGQWDEGFRHGLDAVVKAAIDAWPDTLAVESTSAEILKARISALDLIQPAWYSAEDWAFYRLSMERSGNWVISDVNLGEPLTSG